jgi:hypothetical protein
MTRDLNTFQRNNKKQKKKTNQEKYGKYSRKHIRVQKEISSNLSSNRQQINKTSVSRT